MLKNKRLLAFSLALIFLISAIPLQAIALDLPPIPFPNGGTQKPETSVIVDGIEYLLVEEESTATVTSCSLLSDEIVIPSTILKNGVTYRVTAIDEYAFCNIDEPCSFVIPASVTSIDENAFFDCVQELLIYGSADSEAEAFAHENGFLFVEVPYLAFISLPSQNYVVGQALDVTDGLLRYVDASGTVDNAVVLSAEMVSGFDSSVSGSLTLTVAYGGAETTYDVFVAERQLVSISMNELPGKTSYFVGETLDLTGATIDLYYNDGSVEEGVAVTSQMVSVSQLNEEGDHSITVTYEGKETQFDISVSDLVVSGIEWINEPTNQVFLQGTPLDVTGGKIRVLYNNNTTEEVDLTPSMVGGYNALTIGDQILTVRYSEYELTYKVSVNSKTVSGIQLITLPTKLVYAVGESLYVAGGKLKVLYDNGTSDEVTLRSSMVYGFDSAMEGTHQLTISYEGFSTSFAIQVVSYVKGDLNYDRVCDRNDALYLLYYLFAPEKYPVYQDVDFNNDSFVSDRDVFALLSGDFAEPGGSGVIIPGPGGGADVPPAGTTPLTYSRRNTVIAASLEAPQQIVSGENGEFTLKLDQSTTFTSAFMEITVGANVQVVSAQWLINGDLSHCNIADRLGVFAVENAVSVTGDLIRFTVNSNVLSAGEEIGISVVMKNEFGQIVGTVEANAIVPVVSAAVPFLYGDINADGIVDSQDGLLLIRELNGWKQEIASPEAMDVSGDGIVDSLDGLILLRYLEGWDITLGGTKND